MAAGDPVVAGGNGLSLQQQITNLGIAMEKGFDRMENLFRAFEERMRSMENREAACQPIIQARVDGMKAEIEALKAENKTMQGRVDTLEDNNSSMKTKMNIISWAGGIAGSAVLIDLVTRLMGK